MAHACAHRHDIDIWEGKRRQRPTHVIRSSVSGDVPSEEGLIDVMCSFSSRALQQGASWVLATKEESVLLPVAAFLSAVVGEDIHDSTLTGRQVKWTGIDDGAGTIGAQKRQKTARRGDRVSSAEHGREQWAGQAVKP